MNYWELAFAVCCMNYGLYYELYYELWCWILWYFPRENLKVIGYVEMFSVAGVVLLWRLVLQGCISVCCNISSGVCKGLRCCQPDFEGTTIKGLGLQPMRTLKATATEKRRLPNDWPGGETMQTVNKYASGWCNHKGIKGRTTMLWVSLWHPATLPVLSPFALPFLLSSQ